MAKSNFLDPERPNTGVEACFNLICLCANAHIWNKGLFALKPLELSSDRKKLKVQFFWQPRYDHKVGDKIDLLTVPLSSEGLDSISDEYFLNYRGGDKITSGQPWPETVSETTLDNYSRIQGSRNRLRSLRSLLFPSATPL